jgi:hypothetical protein
VKALIKAQEGTMAWVVYERPPIDMWWNFLQTAADVARDMAGGGALFAIEHGSIDSNGSARFGLNLADTFVKNFHMAQELARQHGWDGDFSTEEPSPRVLWLPEKDSNVFAHAFVWKQDRNDTTYVVSPHPLPWLGEPTTPRKPRR